MARGVRKKELLPLLSALRSMKPDHRVIVLSHFDDKTKDAIYATITNVLTSKKIPIEDRLNLKSRLCKHKDDLRVITCKHKSHCQKRKKLAQVGGGPMGHVLNQAIPLLLDLLR